MPPTLNLQSFRQLQPSDLITRISTSSTGAEADNNSGIAVFSANGRYVAFESNAANLVASDGNNATDIFRKDLATGQLIRVSTAANGAQANDECGSAQISADGRYVIFQSGAGNLVAGDGNDSYDLFRKDLITGGIERISTTASGGEGEGGSYDAHVSADGRYVVFESDAANLVAGGANGGTDIYRKDLVTGAIVRVSVEKDGSRLEPSYNPRVSADGRYVVFENGGAGSQIIYRKDLATGDLVVASSSATGQSASSFSLRPDISADGRYVIFESEAKNLVVGDTTIRDIFRKDMVTGEIVVLSVNAGGRQGDKGSSHSRFAADGQHVVFSSAADNLVPGDANGESDLFVSDLAIFDRKGAVADGRLVNVSFSVGGASSTTIAWGDGSSETLSPDGGRVGASHVYASTGTHAATVSVQEGGQTWAVPFTISLTGRAMARDTVLFDTLSGGDGSDSLVGDENANILVGGANNDTLDGAGSADRLEGGAGSDVYVVDNALDGVVEAAGGGADTVLAWTSYALAAGAEVEVMTAMGSGTIALGGSAIANMLAGNAGANTLRGGQGRDTLSGGAGHDVFVFAEKPDRALNLDRVTDFSVRDDTVWLDNAFMGRLGRGTEGRPQRLKKEYLAFDAAHDRDDHVIYHRKTGVVGYDPDGTGRAREVAIMTFSKHLKLTHKDFFVI